MTGTRLAPAHEAEAEELGRFLRRSFGPAKGEFLVRHGSWWHRGDETRWVLLDGERIAGYCGVIPTRCLVAGEVRPAVWWLDLVIAPEYRGRGLQTRFDDLVRSRGQLVLGFPNAVAADIHRHHGWGVRENLRTLLLPLDPPRIGAVRRSPGPRGTVLRLAAEGSRPLAALWRRRLRGYRPLSARQVDEPDFEQLAAVARAYGDRLRVSTLREASYLRWRYGESPHRHRIYVGGAGRAQIVLVTRRLSDGAERWLDLFGAVDDQELLADLVRFAASRAASAGMAQITVLSSRDELSASLRRLGFVVGSPARFCWLDEDRETMEVIARSTHHWCLGDSDNDDPRMETVDLEQDDS